MSKIQLKYKLKEAGMTAAEVGVVAGSMILTKKFLDFNQLFKNKIASDPTFANGFIMKHQGGVRFAIGLGGAVFIKNPWIKLAFIGIALEGLITEVRTLTTDETGVAFFDKIGYAGNSTTDQQLLDMAARYNAQMGANPTTMYPTSVAAVNPTRQYTTQVAGMPRINLTNSIPMYTAGRNANPLKRWAA